MLTYMRYTSRVRGLSGSLAAMMQRPCGSKCIHTVHLILRLSSSLRDDSTSLVLLARTVSSALIQAGPLQPSWGAKRLQAPCLALQLLSHLISGPDKNGVGGGALSRHAALGGAEGLGGGRASLRWAENAAHVLGPDALSVLAQEVRSLLALLVQTLPQDLSALPAAGR
jgi:hypothetical protein